MNWYSTFTIAARVLIEMLFFLFLSLFELCYVVLWYKDCFAREINCSVSFNIIIFEKHYLFQINPEQKFGVGI